LYGYFFIFAALKLKHTDDTDEALHFAQCKIYADKLINL